MGGPVGRASQVLRAAGWTAALAAALYGADRLLLGERPGPGWVEAERIEEVEQVAGPATVPPYLPWSVRWPPSRMFVRKSTPAGWWVGLNRERKGTVALWIGAGIGPAPPPIQPLEGCLQTGVCPAGWSALSVRSGLGTTVFLLSTLPSGELARIAESLGRNAR